MDKSKFPKADGDFYKALYLNFNDDKVKLDNNDVDNANENYGSASAFLPDLLPKSLLIGKHLLIEVFFFLLPSRFNPTAKHSANFINTFFHCCVVFDVNWFNIFH